jgi:hypothetical protein
MYHYAFLLSTLFIFFLEVNSIAVSRPFFRRLNFFLALRRLSAVSAQRFCLIGPFSL